MRFFRDAPLKRKLNIIIVSTSAATLLLASTVIFAYEFMTMRDRMVEDLYVLAGVIGTASTPALMSGNPTAATESLSIFKAKDNITAAFILDPGGDPFASYARAGLTLPAAPSAVELGTRFTTERLVLSRPVVENGAIIGTVYLESDLDQLRGALVRNAQIIAFVVLLSVLITFVLSLTLQQFISRPILHLLHVEKEVAEKKDFSIRAQKHANDELGALIDGFNEMLGGIEQRDADLNLAKERAEDAQQAL